MAAEFKLARGVVVNDLSGIHEGYSQIAVDGKYTCITVNVSNEHLETVFLRLCREVQTRAYLFLEVPTHAAVEQQLRKSPADPLHKDVYYWDGLDFLRLAALWTDCHELLCQDGLVNVGFGFHNDIDEVRIGPYKIVYVQTRQPEKYQQALAELGFQAEPQIRTVWDNFSQDSPGVRQMVPDAPQTVWALVDSLLRQGLYLAKRIED